MPSTLVGEVAVVTGASGKLGPVWVSALLEAGATVAAVDVEGARPTPQAVELAGKYGPDRLLPVVADVCDRDALAAALAVATEAFGTPTILVNNAGIDRPPGPGSTARLEDIPLADVTDVLDVNVVGAFAAMQVFGGAMAAGAGGSIVNVGSLYASVSPDPRMYDHLGLDPPFLKPPGYGASKAALVNLTRYFATHWAPAGVRVNALSPGGVLGGQDDEFIAKFTGRVPMGRLATDEDLVGPLLFLASSASAYVTGIELKVDGGFTAW